MATTVATGAGTRPDVTLKISQLQNLCKRDPEGYKSDYDAQVRRLRSECNILSLSPSSDPSPRLVELIQFAAAVSSSSYKGNESDAISHLLISLLLGQSTSASTSASSSLQHPIPTSALALHRDVRKACVSALILMRNKGAIPPVKLLELFFHLMSSVSDKGLREHLYRHVVNDVKNVNKKGKRDEVVNRTVRSFLHRIVSATSISNSAQNSASSSLSPTDDEHGGDASDIAAKRAVDMVAELYRKNVWTDERTVAIMATAIHSANISVMAKAMRFFLGIEDKMADDKAREESDQWTGANQIDYHAHSRKTKSRQRQVAKQLKNRKKMQLKRENENLNEREDHGVQASKKLYPAMELLNDPQGLAEHVLKRLRHSSAGSLKFEHKILSINFLTRIVGNHELLLLPLYPFLRRYMGGHQRDVTSILAYTVQSCHQYVTPDEIHGLLKTIAHNFITERCSGEQMAVGINACRAICARSPSALSSNKDDYDNIDDLDQNNTGTEGTIVMDIEAFARDLAAYAKHRDRSVSIAGKTWTNFIRDVHPTLLKRKDRGKTGSALHSNGERPLKYGETRVASGVAGADLLIEYETKKAAYLKAKKERNHDRSISDEDSDEIESITEEIMNDEDQNSCENPEEQESSIDDEWEEVNEEDDSDNEKAPALIPVKEVEGKMVPINQNIKDMDISKMSREERYKLQQDVSSSRVFSISDFEKMKKLVEREERAKRDPRAAAAMKRRKAQGKDFEELSDDDSVDSDEDNIHIKGVVNPMDIMANAKKKRENKLERLEKILAGRSNFEFKQREGGSTNTEKKRKKNFMMSKFSYETRKKRGGKETARQEVAKRHKQNLSRDNKKRRRKF
mmetsp:Transcript_3034/g.4270  ORF Transcript_3034/g.4270 Transcript_3034/m.4270 type:complete len:855 (+) Transcript_3034:123-2687(+)